MELSELNLDEEVRTVFENVGNLLEKAADSETTNPINTVFLAGDYFAREREKLCKKDPSFMSSEQYRQGCEYLAELLCGLDVSSIQHKQSYELLTKIISESEIKLKVSL